jgi:methionine-rich copper-binding protein CopC
MLALGATIWTCMAVSALGHISPTSSTPPANSTVKVLPKSISVTFSDPLVRVERVILTPSSGKNAVRSFALNPKDKRQLLIRTTKRSEAGQYNLYWKVTGADGHSVTGRLRFRTKRAS